MSTQEQILRMDREQALKVITCLREVLDSCYFPDGYAMGFDGVAIERREDANPWCTFWYFDCTFGGDDSRDDGQMRAYVNLINEATDTFTLHDRTDDQAPYIWDNPLVIAKWIMAQIQEGVPDENA